MNLFKKGIYKIFPKLPLLIVGFLEEFYSLLYLGFIYNKFKITLQKGHLPIAICLFTPGDVNHLKDIIRKIENEGIFKIYLFYFFNYNLLTFDSENIIKISKYKSRTLKYLPFKIVLTCESGVKNKINKKSKYAHIIHSMASVHSVYAEGSFDYYDFIFCAGPHHISEFQKLFLEKEKTYILVKAGYPIIDFIKKNNQKKEYSTHKEILFAPSWGINNSLVLYGKLLIESLVNNYKVVLRPHPLNFVYDKEILNEILEKFSNNENFELDSRNTSTEALIQTDLLISDYSGIAMEFCFGKEKPVLYLESECKILNQNWRKYSQSKGVHVDYREETGIILKDLQKINETVENLLFNYDKNKILISREKLLFNYGTSIDYIYESLVQIQKNNLNEFILAGKY